MPANIYRLSDVRAALPGRVKCECSWCGRVFVVWRSRFLRGAKYCPASALWKCSGKSVASLGACTLCGLSGRPEELPEMVREYFRWRLEEALEVLPTDSAMLAEVLNEMFALLVGEEEIKGWRAPALEDVHSRIGESLKRARQDGDKCRAVLTDTGRRVGKRSPETLCADCGGAWTWRAIYF